MASIRDTAAFFSNGTTKQFDYCLKLYPEVLKLKAGKRSKKPEELIKLDDWYQNELPKKIKQRGKDAHMVHEELVQTMKWKQSRGGKFYPQLSCLIKINTPRAVMQETKKAFKKLPNLEQAITALSNLKGVGTTMASALLAAAAPDSAPFMADECLMAIPEIEGIDYTTKEYLNFVQHIQATVKRLNSEKDSTTSWSPHRVELALWTHYVATDLKPELLDDMPQTCNDGTNVISSISTTKFVQSNDDVDDEDLDEQEDEDEDDDGLTTADNKQNNKIFSLKQTNGSNGKTINLNVIAESATAADENSISNESQDLASPTTITTPIMQITPKLQIETKINQHNLMQSNSADNINSVTDGENDATTAMPSNSDVTTSSTSSGSNSGLIEPIQAMNINPNLDKCVTDSSSIEQSDESNLDLPQNNLINFIRNSNHIVSAANGNNGNGGLDSLDECSTRSEDSSLEKPITPIVASDETNDSDSYISGKRALNCESAISSSQPELKKIRNE